MSWLATETMTAQLPDSGGLRAAAYNLRNVGDTLGAQASTVRGIADAIGPGLWQDDASGQAKSTLNGLNGELSAGYSALHQSADALDTLASYVDGQRWRYEEAGREFEGLARDPFGAIEHHELERAEQLVEERRSIENSVGSAMGHAADLINQAAARATRYHGGGSFWSTLKHDAGSLEHGIADFVSGMWDGTYAMGKGLAEIAWSLTVLNFKLSPLRFVLDPNGFMHDAEHAYNTFTTAIDGLAHNKQAFVENLLNLKELKSDPVHWAGELIPTIVSIIVLKGAGSAGDATEGMDAADASANAVAKGAEATRFLPQTTVKHITEGWWNAQKGKGIGLHFAPNGEVPIGRRIVPGSVGPVNSDGSWSAKVQFLTSNGWMPPNGKFSTMFPKSWSEDQTILAVQDAYENRYLVRYTANGTYWEGKYGNMTIGGWLNNADHLPDTAYPIPAANAADPSLTTYTPPPD